MLQWLSCSAAVMPTFPSARRHAYTPKPNMSGTGLDFDQSARPSGRRGSSANERSLGGPSRLTVASRASTPSRVRLRHEMVPFAKKSSAPPSSSKVDTLELDPVELGAHGHPNLLVIVLRCAPGAALARAVEPGQAEVDCVRLVLPRPAKLYYAPDALARAATHLELINYIVTHAICRVP
ncbi:hypothetical protein T492DRAFT_1038535 [Pavlovales sp. CCMP2436]|nr:hypothetical protein T492DRAFT_1038535 [Pavlovales sp. CCMP2436]